MSGDGRATSAGIVGGSIPQDGQKVIKRQCGITDQRRIGAFVERDGVRVDVDLYNFSLVGQ